MSYQKSVFVGNIGGDAELRYTQSGQAVANFSLAVNRKWTGKDGQKQEETTWVRVAVWGKLAEAIHTYLTKGKMVLVESDRIVAKAYVGSDGEAKANLEVTANEIRLLGGAGGNGHTAAPAPIADDEMDEIAF